MMLPIKSQEPNEIPLVVGVIGGNSQIFERIAAIAPRNVALLKQSEVELEQTDPDLSPGTQFGILACDAVIGVVDGDLGIGPSQISAWAEIIDHDIPRIILAVNTVQGRADFDEVLALSELVLNEDIAMRYYPVVDDVEENYVALLDVLTHEIVQPGEPNKPADSEHISLTIEEHNELVDQLALADLTSDTYESHTLGNPISMPKLRQLWEHSDIVTVVPFDGEVSDQVLDQWLSQRRPIWLPSVSVSDETFSVTDLQQPIGIGIAKGVARVWNLLEPASLEACNSAEQDEIENPVTLLETKNESVLIFNDGIDIGDTIRPLGSEYLVAAPSF